MSIFRKIFGRHEKGIPGVLSEWVDVASFPITNGLLYVADFGAFSDDVLGFRLSEGEYAAQLRFISYGRDKRIARVRLCKGGSEFTNGTNLGEVAINTATILLCDGVFLWLTFARGIRTTSYGAKNWNPI